MQRSLGDADVSHSFCFADSNAKAQAGQGVGQLRQGHGQWRLWRDTEGQGRIAVGNRPDQDQGA